MNVMNIEYTYRLDCSFSQDVFMEHGIWHLPGCQCRPPPLSMPQCAKDSTNSQSIISIHITETHHEASPEEMYPPQSTQI